MALVRREAALIVKDADAPAQLIPLAISTLSDPVQLYTNLGANAKKMALPDSANIIAREVEKLATHKL